MLHCRAKLHEALDRLQRVVTAVSASEGRSQEPRDTPPNAAAMAVPGEDPAEQLSPALKQARPLWRHMDAVSRLQLPCVHAPWPEKECVVCFCLMLCS